VCAPDAVIAMDDFEGWEKGVVNYSNLKNASYLSSHVLVYPCSDTVLQKFGLLGHSTIALMIPQSSIRFTPQ
jgi:hypothetical protein